MRTAYFPKIDRRAAIQWILAASALPGLSRGDAAGAHEMVAYHSVPGGYGTDPLLLNPVTPWARIMTPHQLQVTAVLSDLILPGTPHALAPSAIGIPDFVDEWVSAPYPVQIGDREIILAGLAWVDQESRKRWQRDFLEADAQGRREILDVMATEKSGLELATQNIFLRRLRCVVLGAYYTTPEGFKDIGYIGNVALTSYPPTTNEEMAILDAELRKLGLAQDPRTPKLST